MHFDFASSTQVYTLPWPRTTCESIAPLTMWLLSASGDLFGGRRQWLRPGSTHLLGRTTGRSESGEQIRFIAHKSVSRKHLLITVDNVRDGDVSSLHKRTRITLTDNSKVGTFVNGEKVVKADKVLEGPEKVWTIKLGSQYEQELKLEWLDVTLTCAGLKGKLDEQKRRLAGTDVKTLEPFVASVTTHVLSAKRNIPQVLQGLVAGLWTVNYDWLEMVASVTQRKEGEVTADGDPRPSALEQDLDAYWPSEAKFPIKAGKEPNARPDEYMVRNPERGELFQDWIFVFMDQSQYDTLMGVVTGAGGKSVVKQIEPGVTRPAEVVDFVRQVASSKGDSQFRLTEVTGNGGIAVIRINFKHGDVWEREFTQQLESMLYQRTMPQNELLDVILTLDTSTLRQPLRHSSERETVASSKKLRQVPTPPSDPPRPSPQEEEPTVIEDERQPSPEQPTTASVEQGTEQPLPTATSRRWNRRAVTKSRFKGFDDFDTSQFTSTKARSPSPEESFREPSQPPSVQEMDIDLSQPAHSQQTTRKRPAASQLPEEEEGDIFDSVLKGQAALKRRKTEAAARKGANGPFARTAEDSEASKAEKEAVTKKRAKQKQVDVKAAIAARRAEEEERRRKDEEALREQLEGVDIGDIQPEIEEMEVRVREKPAPRADGHSDRWDPKWDGRKNFKRFRPKNQRGQVGERRPPRVFVRLEEVRNPRHGLGEEYWLEPQASPATQRSRGQSRSQGTASQQRVSQTGTAGDDFQFRRSLHKSRDEDGDAANATPADQDLRLDGEAPPATSETWVGDSQRGSEKRPAIGQGGGPAKRARQTAFRSAPSVQEDDSMAFRRKRR